MSGLLFVSQATLDAWVDQGRIALDRDVMAVADGDGPPRRYALVPAVRFLAVLGGDADAHRLVRKVKTDAQLRALGGEWLGDSVVLGDTAYEVQPGFLAELSAGGRHPGSHAVPADDQAAAHALARFLLENLA